MKTDNTYTAFEGEKLLTQGQLGDVVLKVKQKIGKFSHAEVLIFSDLSGKALDFNFQGSEKEVLKRLEVYTSTTTPESSGPGRPKLGVISREVSLLPRHWEWLGTQSGGASATLRKLVEESMKKSLTGNFSKKSQDRTYHFMAVAAGNLTGYEEALRFLYRKDEEGFKDQIKAWPKDIQKYILQLSENVFS